MLQFVPGYASELDPDACSVLDQALVELDDQIPPHNFKAELADAVGSIASKYTASQ